MDGVAEPSSFQTWLRLLRYVKPHRARLVLAFVAMAILAAAEGLQTWLIGPLLQFLMSGGKEGGEAFLRVVPWLSAPDIPARCSRPFRSSSSPWRRSKARRSSRNSTGWPPPASAWWPACASISSAT
ncbi:MAG: hypothetical protein ACRELA_15070 [Candidatus Rokuibacteriota bacterium]